MAATSSLRVRRKGATLALLIAWLGAGTGTAAAEPQAAARLSVYSDTDNTLVITPMIAVAAEPAEGATISARYLADTVSSASVDLVSAATKRFSERRDEVAFAGSYATNSYLTLSGGYDWSHERDYVSHTVNGGVSKELNARHLLLALGWASSFNTVGRSGDPSFSESLVNHSLTARGAQVINKDTVVQLTYQGQRADGFQESVYRYVPLEGVFAAIQTPERVPDIRWRHAIAANLKRHLSGPLFASASYRYYRDTWGIVGHTGGADLTWSATSRLNIRIRDRVHYQGAAAFYANSYAEPQTYMSRDKELGELVSNTVGLKLDYLVRPSAGAGWGWSGLRLEAKVDYLSSRYLDYDLLDSLDAAVGELGATVTF